MQVQPNFKSHFFITIASLTVFIGVIYLENLDIWRSVYLLIICGICTIADLNLGNEKLGLKIVIFLLVALITAVISQKCLSDSYYYVIVNKVPLFLSGLAFSNAKKLHVELSKK